MPTRQPDNQRKRRKKAVRTRLSVADRRNQLLELGMAAFLERPYDAVSIDEIAARAGVSRGLVFHYFQSKHAYYLAVLGGAAEMLLERTVQAMPEGPPAERLHAGLHGYFQFVEEHGSAYATLLRGGVGNDPAVTDLVEATRQRIIDTIRENVEGLLDDVPPAQLRAALRGWIGMVEALALDWIDNRDLDRDELVAMAIRGVMVIVPHAASALFTG